jgi:hypothetical protein
VIGMAFFLGACQRQGVTESRDANSRVDEVTVYVSTDRVFSEPVQKAYERKTSVKVNIGNRCKARRLKLNNSGQGA